MLTNEPCCKMLQIIQLLALQYFLQAIFVNALRLHSCRNEIFEFTLHQISSYQPFYPKPYSKDPPNITITFAVIEKSHLQSETWSGFILK